MGLNTNLIFVDGLPGSGKSTTAQLLYLHLKHLGYKASWFHEEETGHPIHNPDGSPGSEEEHFQKWIKLRESLEGTDHVFILDGSLFQNTVGWLLAMGYDEPAIQHYVQMRTEILTPLKPVVLYLRHEDVKHNMSEIFAERGREWSDLMVERLGAAPYGENISPDVAGVIQYYCHLQSLTDHLFDVFPWSKLQLTSGSWDLCSQKIVDHFHLPAYDQIFKYPPFTEELAGRYREKSGQFHWDLVYDGQTFYIDDEPRTLLRHKGGSGFYASGSCIELEFQQGEDGAAVFTCGGNHPTWEGLGSVWEKI